MIFWDAIGDFFATLEPKDWVTAGLALGAIIVSGFTAAQTWRYHPKPLMAIEYNEIQVEAWTDDREDGRSPQVSVGVSNLGNATAYDVYLTLYSPALTEPTVIRRTKLAVADTWNWVGSLVPPLGVDYDDASEKWVTAERWSGRIHPRQVKVVVSWRQSPSMWRRRRKVVRFLRTTERG